MGTFQHTESYPVDIAKRDALESKGTLRCENEKLAK